MYTYGNVIAICVSAAGSLCKDSSLSLFGEGKAVKCTFSVYVLYYDIFYRSGSWFWSFCRDINHCGHSYSYHYEMQTKKRLYIINKLTCGTTMNYSPLCFEPFRTEEGSNGQECGI